jgi:hypothetical protein
MLTNSLAPIKRAGLFFGFMGVAVASLTFGAGLQMPTDQSSSTIAQTKIQHGQPTDQQFASVDPGQKVVGSTKRAIPNSQQAMVGSDRAIVAR